MIDVYSSEWLQSVSAIENVGASEFAEHLQSLAEFVEDADYAKAAELLMKELGLTDGDAHLFLKSALTVATGEAHLYNVANDFNHYWSNTLSSSGREAIYQDMMNLYSVEDYAQNDYLALLENFQSAPPSAVLAVLESMSETFSKSRTLDAQSVVASYSASPSSNFTDLREQFVGELDVVNYALMSQAASLTVDSQVQTAGLLGASTQLLSAWALSESVLLDAPVAVVNEPEAKTVALVSSTEARTSLSVVVDDKAYSVRYLQDASPLDLPEQDYIEALATLSALIGNGELAEAQDVMLNTLSMSAARARDFIEAALFEQLGEPAGVDVDAAFTDFWQNSALSDAEKDTIYTALQAFMNGDDTVLMEIMDGRPSLLALSVITHMDEQRSQNESALFAHDLDSALTEFQALSDAMQLRIHQQLQIGDISEVRTELQAVGLSWVETKAFLGAYSLAEHSDQADLVDALSETVAKLDVVSAALVQHVSMNDASQLSGHLQLSGLLGADDVLLARAVYSTLPADAIFDADAGVAAYGLALTAFVELNELYPQSNIDSLEGALYRVYSEAKEVLQLSDFVEIEFDHLLNEFMDSLGAGSAAEQAFAEAYTQLFLNFTQQNLEAVLTQIDNHAIADTDKIILAVLDGVLNRDDGPDLLQASFSEYAVDAALGLLVASEMSSSDQVAFAQSLVLGNMTGAVDVLVASGASDLQARAAVQSYRGAELLFVPPSEVQAPLDINFTEALMTNLFNMDYATDSSNYGIGDAGIWTDSGGVVRQDDFPAFEFVFIDDGTTYPFIASMIGDDLSSAEMEQWRAVADRMATAINAHYLDRAAFINSNSNSLLSLAVNSANVDKVSDFLETAGIASDSESEATATHLIQLQEEIETLIKTEILGNDSLAYVPSGAGLEDITSDILLQYLNEHAGLPDKASLPEVDGPVWQNSLALYDLPDYEPTYYERYRAEFEANGYAFNADTGDRSHYLLELAAMTGVGIAASVEKTYLESYSWPVGEAMLDGLYQEFANGGSVDIDFSGASQEFQDAVREALQLSDNAFMGSYVDGSIEDNVGPISRVFGIAPDGSNISMSEYGLPLYGSTDMLGERDWAALYALFESGDYSSEEFNQVIFDSQNEHLNRFGAYADESKRGNAVGDSFSFDSVFFSFQYQREDEAALVAHQQKKGDLLKQVITLSGDISVDNEQTSADIAQHLVDLNDEITDVNEYLNGMRELAAITDEGDPDEFQGYSTESVPGLPEYLVANGITSSLSDSDAVPFTTDIDSSRQHQILVQKITAHLDELQRDVDAGNTDLQQAFFVKNQNFELTNNFLTAFYKIWSQILAALR